MSDNVFQFAFYIWKTSLTIIHNILQIAEGAANVIEKWYQIMIV